MSRLLRQGDIFEVKVGDEIYANIPEKYVYDNVTERNVTANNLTETEVTVGEIFKTSKSKFDTKKFVGDYVVFRTAKEGGGTGHGRHDVFPDGHHITARKLTRKGTYSKKGLKISFYQSGCFTVTRENVKVKGKFPKKPATRVQLVYPWE